MKDKKLTELSDVCIWYGAALSEEFLKANRKELDKLSLYDLTGCLNCTVGYEPRCELYSSPFRIVMNKLMRNSDESKIYEKKK